MEAQLGLIGGTMGLLTGFSILSGIEIVYFLLRFLKFPLNSTSQFALLLVYVAGVLIPQVLLVTQDPMG